MPADPLEVFLGAFKQAGWIIEARKQIGSSPKPTRVAIRRGRTRYDLLVYAWFITSEGKGRRKTDYRVQTTRSHEGPLLALANTLNCGIGWDEEREVFAAFDPWTKRYTGKSSSIHIPRSLLDEAQQSGWATLVKPEYGPESAFNQANIESFLGWVINLGHRRLLPLDPSEFNVNGDTAEIVADRIRQPYAPWLRLGDHIILRRGTALLDSSVWQVAEIDARPETTASANYNRESLIFKCSRIGSIQDQAWAGRAEFQ